MFLLKSNLASSFIMVKKKLEVLTLKLGKLVYMMLLKMKHKGLLFRFQVKLTPSLN